MKRVTERLIIAQLFKKLSKLSDSKLLERMRAKESINNINKGKVVDILRVKENG